MPEIQVFQAQFLDFAKPHAALPEQGTCPQGETCDYDQAQTGVSNAYGYDANGNQTTRTINGVTLTLAYDAEGRMVSVTGPSLSASFVYDGDGKRVKSTINGTTTYFVGSHYEVTEATITKYYFAGSQRVAMKTGSTVYYLLTDHLGSTSLTTYANGSVASEMRYSAWGGVRFSSGTTPTDYTYTGQYSDSEIDLLDYVARRYDPYLNHFTQPDSIVPDPYNSQDWDRYSYGLNNPIRYNDPSGHCPICIGLVLVGAFFIFNGTSDSYQSNLSISELESRQASVELGVGFTLSGLAIQAPIIEALSNLYDCATGYCDPTVVLPGSGAPYREALEDGVTVIPARDIRWTQDTVTRRTSDGMFIDELADDMILNGWKGDPLDAVIDRGSIWSIDNRRLAAAKLADINVPVNLHNSPSDLNAELFRRWIDHFTTDTGLFVDVVQHRNEPKLGIKIRMGGDVEFYDP